MAIKAPPAIELVQVATAAYFGMSRYAMVSDSRKIPIVLPRQIAMYVCRKETVHSFPEIGLYFGGRDHSTVVHAVTKIAKLINESPPVDAAVKAITAKFREQQGTNYGRKHSI